MKRMPYKRGFTNIFRAEWEVINLRTLADHDVTGEVTPQLLVERGLIRGAGFPIKVLGSGEATAKLTVSAHAFSESAKTAIEAAGGTVIVLERTDRWITARPRSRRLNLNRELKDARFGKVGGPQTRDEISSTGE